MRSPKQKYIPHRCHNSRSSTMRRWNCSKTERKIKAMSSMKRTLTVSLISIRGKRSNNQYLLSHRQKCTISLALVETPIASLKEARSALRVSTFRASLRPTSSRPRRSLMNRRSPSTMSQNQDGEYRRRSINTFLWKRRTMTTKQSSCMRIYRKIILRSSKKKLTKC